jgi:hypothetical protein
MSGMLNARKLFIAKVYENLRILTKCLFNFVDLYKILCRTRVSERQRRRVGDRQTDWDREGRGGEGEGEEIKREKERQADSQMETDTRREKVVETETVTETYERKKEREREREREGGIEGDRQTGRETDRWRQR